MDQGRSCILVRHLLSFTDRKYLDVLYLAELQQVPLTTYVVADLDTEAGQAFVREALTAAVRSPPRQAER